MTNDRTNPMSCAEFSSALGDLLDGTMTTTARDRMDAHRLDCASCDAMAADFVRIKGEAAQLPTLSPSRDLWDGIESRIGADVLELPVNMDVGVASNAVVESPAAFMAPVSPLAATRNAVWRIRTTSPWPGLAAASVLITLTAAITWSIASNPAPRRVATTAADSGFAVAMAGTRNTRLASNQTLAETYDHEIATLRKIVDERRADIDSATLVVVERNMKVIDQAIAESKAALSASPSSAFLLDRLTDAYDSKLRMLRAVAAIPLHG